MYSRIAGMIAAIAPSAVSVAALKARSRSFSHDERGSIAMVFGLMVVPCILMVGISVDLGRMISVRNQTQTILDSAALAGGRAAQLATSDPAGAASKAAQDYFNAHVIPHVVQTKVSEKATAENNNTQFTWTVESWVRTPFISSASIRNTQSGTAGSPDPCPKSGWFCRKVTASTTAILANGGKNKDSSVEVSMMLDVTGSMSGTKIADLKVAAKDLIDIVVQADQSSNKTRVALAPFAEAVNVGPTLAPIVRGTVLAGTNSTVDVPGYNKFKFKKSSSSTSTFTITSSCVTERIGTNATTDVAPTSASTYVGRYYTTDGNCSVVKSDAEANVITPLSADKDMLKRHIDKLTIAGSTAGQIGTAWAWYLLSPTWNSIFPQASAAASYSENKNRKIAVLMTDGDYNTEYWNGVEAKTSLSGDAYYNANNGLSELQAPLLCTAMKAKGIEVYTVGFQVSSAAKALLTNCASDVSHYYDATSGEALKQAFRDIALKISTLRIAK